MGQINRERRDYFRLNQDLLLEYHQVDNECKKRQRASACFADNSSLTLFGELRRIDQEAANLLDALHIKHREVADYLKLLNRKFELLAQQLTATTSLETPQSKARVNISEGGLAFTCDKAFYKGSQLALRLVFLPDFVGVELFAEVIRCDSDNHGKHLIAARFDQRDSAPLQIIAKQLMHAQLNRARSQKHTEA